MTDLLQATLLAAAASSLCALHAATDPANNTSNNKKGL
jgi:hypothetical protein